MMTRVQGPVIISSDYISIIAKRSNFYNLCSVFLLLDPTLKIEFTWKIKNLLCLRNPRNVK